MFENRVLRRTFGPKRDEVTGELRNLYNDVVKYQYSSPYIIWVIISRRMRWARHVARMGDRRSVYRVLVWQRERKRPVRNVRLGCDDNIKVDLQQVGSGDVEWIELVQDRDRWRALVN